VHSAEVDCRRRVDVMITATRITDRCVHHGEGPFWDARGERLLFVDLLAGAVLAMDAGGFVTRHPVGSSVAAVVRSRSGGGFVFATEHGFSLASDDLASLEALPDVFDDPAVRMNDGGCDPQGRFYCGTMAYAETPGAGSLYRLDADRSVHTVLEGVTISNGLQWSAHGDRVFYNDTPTGEVAVFDFDAASGTFRDRRTFVRVSPYLPDGMAVDEEDGLWVALWGAGRVHRYAADGSLSEVVEIPASRVTACAFGGTDLRTLYITTSRLGLGPDDEPDAGSIFAIQAGVAGALQHAFAG
jgi:sugar lactone lactonase YvrE